VSQRVRRDDGSVRYLFDQLENDASITFNPAGLWGNDLLLHGRLATVWDDEVSQTLMKQFAKPLRKSFRKIKAFWVGPEAEAMLDAGKRLTIGAQSPRDFDLRRSE
jgi:hypothetical protein